MDLIAPDNSMERAGWPLSEWLSRLVLGEGAERAEAAVALGCIQWATPYPKVGIARLGPGWDPGRQAERYAAAVRQAVAAPAFPAGEFVRRLMARELARLRAEGGRADAADFADMGGLLGAATGTGIDLVLRRWVLVPVVGFALAACAMHSVRVSRTLLLGIAIPLLADLASEWPAALGATRTISPWRCWLELSASAVAVLAGLIVAAAAASMGLGEGPAAMRLRMTGVGAVAATCLGVIGVAHLSLAPLPGVSPWPAAQSPASVTFFLPPDPPEPSHSVAGLAVLIVIGVAAGALTWRRARARDAGGAAT